MALLDQACTDLEAAVARLAGQIGQRRSPQSPAWCQQGYRFENICLARAIVSPQQVQLSRAAKLGLAVVAKVGKGNAVERHEMHARLANRVELAITPIAEINDPESW